jgi:hypothetical protein
MQSKPLSDKDALKLIAKNIAQHGISQVAISLGYKSDTAIRAWIRRERVPLSVKMLIHTLWGKHENNKENTF